MTYWGDHGLGDSAKLPIGNFKVVKQINGTDAYIDHGPLDQLGIGKFTVRNHQLYAEVNDRSSDANYVIWDLNKDGLAFFETREAYLAANNTNPDPQDFEDYWIHYDKYWNGWRFWLLP